MRRREFIASLSSAMAVWPVAARAQQTVRMKRIGILLYARQDQATIAPMLRGLEALGYVDGKNLAVEYRDADGNSDQLAEAANELARLKPTSVEALRHIYGVGARKAEDLGEAVIAAIVEFGR